MHEPGDLPMSYIFVRCCGGRHVSRKEISMKKIVSILLSACFVMGAVCACDSTPATEEETQAETTTEATEEETSEETAEESAEESEEETSDAGDSIYPFDYTDAYGNTVTIEGPAETVVSVSPALTEIIYALGAEDKLIGRSDYCDYPEQVFDIQAVGPIDLPDTELIISLDPDIVIASSIFSEEAYNALTDAGLTVAIVRDESTFDGMFDVVSDVADIIGVPENGEYLVADMQARYDEIATEPSEDAPSVYYCMGYGEYGEYTAGGDTFINDIIEAAGATNAAGDVEGWSFSLEALLEADPDYILVPAWGYDAFIETEPYTDLTAVQEGRVISIDNNMFERQGPRNLDAIELIQDAIADFADAEAEAA